MGTIRARYGDRHENTRRRPQLFVSHDNALRPGTGVPSPLSWAESGSQPATRDQGKEIEDNSCAYSQGRYFPNAFGARVSETR